MRELGALGIVYAVMSLITLAAYWLDKASAKRGTWRTPEKTLHLLALLGGWPGALVAQRVFRHKTRKQPFRTVFWFTVVANVGIVALIAWAVARDLAG